MNHWRIFYAGAVVRLVHCGDLLCDPVPVLESMCADRKRQFILKRKCKMFSKYQSLRIAARSCVVCGNCFLAILAVRQPGISIFMITAVLLSVMISVLAAALSHLVLKAYELKQENELTI